MRKVILVILCTLLAVLFSVNVYALPVGEFPLSNEGTEVLTVFAAQRKQPHPTFTTNSFRINGGLPGVSPAIDICILQNQHDIPGAGIHINGSVHTAGQDICSGFLNDQMVLSSKTCRGAIR